MSVIFPRLPLMAPPTVEKGTTPIMHPIKRTLALMLTLSLSVSCLPSAVLAVEEPAAATAEVSASTDVTLTAEETPAVTADDLPEQTPTAGNAPVTDAQVQQALETFDPTIDDPQYRKEYSRYQQSKEEGDIALAAMDSGPELMSASNPYTGKKYTHTHAKTKYIYYGIDVSQWQGTVNWKKVKADGISFVFIRCSYTSLKSFNLHTDPKFKANVEAAAAAGLKVGVYHYSGATSATEAKKEANYVVNLLKPYKSKITLPVMFDYEPGERVTANYKKTSKTTRTKYATTFCNAAKAAGYTSGVYCSTSWFPTYFNVSSLSGYSNWDAQWASKNTYTGAYDFWQYSDSGKISGISGSVDCNFWYTNTKISGSTTTGGSTGTVPDSNPTPETASTALTAPHVTNAAVNYRMAAGTSGTLAGTLPKGTVIDLVYGYHKTVNGAKWYKFNYNGHAYYIHEDYVDREVLQHHTATKALSYHTSASASAAVKGSFASGDSVQVVQGGSQTADGAQWHKVKVGSSYYYAAAKHLTPAETFVDSVAKKNVNVRTKAGTSQTKAAYLYAGTPVTVVNGKSVAVSGERWEQVKIGSKYYYILGSYLTKASSSKALTAANTTVVLKYTSTPYTGKALKPAVTVTYNGATLVKGTLAKGSAVQIVKGWSKKANGYTWYKLRIKNSYYYIASSNLKKAEKVKMYNTKSKVNLRSGAGTNHAIVATLAAKTPVAVVSGGQKTVGNETWEMVKVNTDYYYILGSYLQK